MKTDQYLEHYGVKGQKWGVRNDPSYLNKNTYTIKKGTHLKRFTNTKTERKSMKGKYVSYRKNDTNEYLMTAINNNLGFKKHKQIWEQDIELVDDATVLSGKAAVDEVLKTINDKDLTADYNKLVKSGYMDENKNLFDRRQILNKEIEDHPKRKRTNYDRASDIGNTLNAFMYSEKGKAFIDSLSGKYDATVDPEDFVLGYQSPLILLNDSKFKESNNPKQIKNEKWYKDHPDAYVPKKYLKQVNKHG